MHLKFLFCFNNAHLAERLNVGNTLIKWKTQNTIVRTVQNRVEQIETTLKPLTQIYTTPPFPGLIQTEEDIALPGVWACRLYRQKRYTQWQT
jgi:hypothetical protein